MKPKLLPLMLALLMALTGCVVHPSTAPGRQNKTNTPNPTPGYSADQVTQPQNPDAPDGSTLGSPSRQDTPQVTEPVTNTPGKAVGVTVWAVDTAGKKPPELLYDNQWPLFLLGVSPDARYWLLDKVSEFAMGDPEVAYLLDRETGALTQGPELYMHPAKVAWSGHGFWVENLVHLGLDLQVEQYQNLRQAVGLGLDRWLIGASFSADGVRVALVVDDHRYSPEDARADLILAEADGTILGRVDHSIQPWCYDGKAGPFVYPALSPRGDRLALSAQSPGDVLIDTANLDPARWRSLSGALTPPVPFGKMFCGPGSSHPVWSPDGTRVWVPGTGVIEQNGKPIATSPFHSRWAIWTPDGAGLIVSSDQGASFFRTVPLDGQSQDFPIPEGAQAIAFLPDGRLLVARTIYP